MVVVISVKPYEIYLKMAQNCCDRDRATRLDMQSNFKMAQEFSLLFWAVLRFELQDGPKFQMVQRLNLYQNWFWQNFQISWALSKFEPIWSLGPFWSSNLKMAPNEREKFLSNFEVWMHIKSREPISVTAVLSHFEVYLVLNWIKV